MTRALEDDAGRWRAPLSVGIPMEASIDRRRDTPTSSASCCTVRARRPSPQPVYMFWPIVALSDRFGTRGARRLLTAAIVVTSFGTQRSMGRMTRPCIRRANR
jgi:hypothetical protein